MTFYGRFIEVNFERADQKTIVTPHSSDIDLNEVRSFKL